jgi:hypothetical protein
MFQECETEEQATRLYWRLAKYFHPDSGGEADLFILLQNAKEERLSFINMKEELAYQEKRYQKEKPKEKPSEKPRAEKPQKAYPKEGKYQPAEDVIIAGDNRLEILADIWEYSEENPRFNTSFLEEISQSLDKRGFLTEIQYSCLLNIYYGFKLHIKVAQHA